MNQLVDPIRHRPEIAAAVDTPVEKAALSTATHCPVCAKQMIDVLSRGTKARVCLEHRMCLPALVEA